MCGFSSYSLIIVMIHDLQNCAEKENLIFYIRKFQGLSSFRWKTSKYIVFDVNQDVDSL